MEIPVVFDTDILNTFFFFPTAEISARLTGKMDANLPVEEGSKCMVSLTNLFLAVTISSGL